MNLPEPRPSIVLLSMFFQLRNMIVGTSSREFPTTSKSPKGSVYRPFGIGKKVLTMSCLVSKERLMERLSKFQDELV